MHLNHLHKQCPGKQGITDYGKQVLQKLAKGFKPPGVTFWPHEAGNLDPVRQQVAEAVAELSLSATHADSHVQSSMALSASTVADIPASTSSS